ncbi:MAG: rhomboid family intramembrane serine protease [Saprospiraceae bacterium]|nr:rhomboid family intramembrane serine protease [Bacteroidia bacterium]NNE16785.1 rhomboid family intramembrane serine protease [Saprospiraceae bacterium]NNL92827.1 rhomboid family intramembrane serine protease [Saprospiraceae bacterium]
MPPISDIVKHLIIINVLVFFAYNSVLGTYIPDLSIYWPEDPRFKPFQIVTHMFHHYNLRHVGFNMFALYIFGSMVERALGPKRFLQLYLLSGFGAFLAHVGIQYFMHFNYNINGFVGALGASGAVMGVTIAYAVLFPNHKLLLLIPPIPIKAKYLALAYVAYDLYSGLSGADNGVANWAHLGGALTGFLLVKYLLKRR